MPVSEVITIGTEIILGQILDTNSHYLSQRLKDIGIPVRYRTAVMDNIEDIVSAIKIAKQRADLIITTGGLGPTEDDLTREAISKLTGAKLIFNEELFGQIREIFEKLGFKMPEKNRKQALIPEGSIPIPNRIGTAPGFIKEFDSVPIVCLPGVPRELRLLMEENVIPWLKERFSLEKVCYKVLKVVGVGESKVDRMVYEAIGKEDPEHIGLIADETEVKIRITAKGKDAEKRIEELESKIRKRLGRNIYGEDDDTLEDVIGRMLDEMNLTVSSFETFSGGRLSQRLSLISNFIQGKVIVRKKTLEDIIGREIKSCDKEAAIFFARMIKEDTGSDVGISILGFPVKKGNELLVSCSTAVEGKGVSSAYTWTMGGDLLFMQERASAVGMNTLRLFLIDLKKSLS